MKQFILLSFLYTLSIVSFGQSDNDSAPELTAADTVHKWSDMDLALTKWQEVKDVFVPKDIKSTTLLLETHTLQQHREYFKNLITKYYLEKEIDTSVAKYPKGMSHFIKEQEKEVHYFKQHYKGTITSINEEEIKTFNTDEYRYVLKKIIKVDNVDPKSGHGEAKIEYYFYDRKENKEYPHINSKYHWLITHLNH